MKYILIVGIATTLTLGTAACGGDSRESGNGADAAGSGTSEGMSSGTQSVGVDTNAAASVGGVQEYTVHGVVRKVDAERQTITVDHEKIGDYMEAMTMPFKVADPAILDQVKVGEETHFTLRVAGDQALITRVQAEHESGEEH